MDIRAQYTDAYFRRDTIECQYYERKELRSDQLVAMKYLEKCKRILSIGVGRGFMEDELNKIGHEVTGLDIVDNRHFDFPLIVGGLECFPEGKDFDAIVFVESIEHIPEQEFKIAWPKIIETLRRTGGRFIVSNWDHMHPILVNGIDHVWEINDSVFDWLASFAPKIIYRNCATLVLEF